MKQKNISVKSSKGSYEVLFTNDALKRLKSEYCSSDYLCVDKNVGDLFPEYLSINQSKTFILDSSENSKSYEGVIPLLTKLISSGFKRDGKLYAIGGGITQDAVSFIASMLYRGVEWNFIPTSLLSQCDSCIGSKTSINFRQYKNQLGGFYPPSMVFIDTSFTKTLGGAEISSGLGEMLHYFTVTSKIDFDFFVDRAPSVKKSGNGLEEMISRSLMIKKKMVELDEFDRGPRNIFNYGHSFGHALESSCNYSLPHGIAVSYGIDLANIIAVHLGLIDMNLRNYIRSGAELVFSGFECPEFDIENYFEALQRDKKNSGTKLGLILLSDIGSASKVMVEFSEDIKEQISSFFSNKLYLRDL